MIRDSDAILASYTILIKFNSGLHSFNLKANQESCFKLEPMNTYLFSKATIICFLLALRPQHPLTYPELTVGNHLLKSPPTLTEQS